MMKRIRRSQEDEFLYNDSLNEDFLFVIKLFAKILFFPVYFVILFYRNVSALWSDMYIAEKIRKCRKIAERNNTKLSDEFVVKYLRQKGIYTVDGSDIRSMMRVMKSEGVKNGKQKIKGGFGLFFESLRYIFFGKDYYCTLKLA